MAIILPESVQREIQEKERNDAKNESRHVDLGRELDILDLCDMLLDYLCETHGEVKTIAVFRYGGRWGGGSKEPIYYSHPSFLSGGAESERARKWIAKRLIEIGANAQW